MKILTYHDIEVTFSSATTLRDTLTNVHPPISADHPIATWNSTSPPSLSMPLTIESNHTIAWSQASVLTTTSSRYHLNLAEHAAIQVRIQVRNW